MNKNKNRQYTKNPKNCNCYICGEVGHISPNYPKRIKRETVKYVEEIEEMNNINYEPIEYDEELSEINEDEEIMIIEEDCGSSEDETEEYEINMMTEIKEIEEPSEREENNEEIRGRMCFDIQKYDKIRATKLDINPKENFKLPIFERKKSTIIIARNNEQPIDIEQAQGKTIIPLITERIIRQEMEKINEKTRKTLS